MKRVKLLAFGLVAMLVSAAAPAERSEEFGDYTVHFNAFTTDLLDPTIARTYRIVRSSNRALINIAVLRKVMGTTGQPVEANVRVTAVNLSQQFREVPMRKLDDEGGGIYYIGEIPVNDQETLDFTIEVTPRGESQAHTAEFQQQFFTR